jgi:zinc/manganese transport system substrate-binding protein
MKKQLMSVTLAALGLLGAGTAEAKLKVVTTIQTFASVAKEIGGDKIEVASLSKGSQDPHFVDAKPSLASILSKADVLIYAGLELEIGWLPTLLTSAHNPAISEGGAGDFDASKYVKIVDVASTADRSLGDIHPAGNPHYFTSPKEMLRIARGMADKFKELDPDNASTYEDGYTAFETKVKKKMAEWEKKMAPYKGAKVVTYHKSWTYMIDWLGFVPVGYVEPKPGITPDPSYLASLVSTMKSEGVKAVLAESYYNPKISGLVAEKAGAKLLSLPANVGGDTGATDYVAMMDEIVTQLDTTLSGK